MSQAEEATPSTRLHNPSQQRDVRPVHEEKHSESGRATVSSGALPVPRSLADTPTPFPRLPKCPSPPFTPPCVSPRHGSNFIKSQHFSFVYLLPKVHLARSTSSCETCTLAFGRSLSTHFIIFHHMETSKIGTIAMKMFAVSYLHLGSRIQQIPTPLRELV